MVNQAIENRDSLQREKISNTMQTIDNQTILSQEIARRTSAYRELDRLLNNREYTFEGLADRYYADPVLSPGAERYDQGGERFPRSTGMGVFTARALEFKWNKDFEINYLDKDWSLPTLYKLRNFLELQEMVGALEQFNTINLVGFNREESSTRFLCEMTFWPPSPASPPTTECVMILIQTKSSRLQSLCG